jgi:hypothetical protein
MSRPTNARPYDPDLAAAFELELEEKAQALRQALLPLRAFTQRRYKGIHLLPAAKQAAYHQDTQALEAIPLAVVEFTTTLSHLLASLWQEVLAAEAGTGVRQLRREVRALRLYRQMFDVLLSVVDFPADSVPDRYQKMQAMAQDLQTRYPNGLPDLPPDWEAPLLARRLRDPVRAHEPSVPVPVPPRKSAA